MIPTFDNLLIPSFTLWVDNVLCNKGQGYTNYSGVLYPVNDKKIANYNIYAAPFRSWVSDSSVSGAIIPNGVYNSNGNFLTRNSGIIFDFQNGRVLTTGSYTGLSGYYAFKDFSVKYTSESEENILFNNALKLEPKYNNGPITGINSTATTVPVVFIKYEAGIDVPFSFGAEFRNTQSSFRCIVIVDDPYLLDNCLGLLRDQTEKIFPVTNLSNLPYNYYGDLKTGYYNYNDIINNQIGYCFISKISTMKFSEVSNISVGRGLWAGWVDVEIETYRNRNGIF